MIRLKSHPNINRTTKNQRIAKIPVLENAIHTHIANYLNMVIKRPSRWHTVEVSNQSSGRSAMLRQMALKRKGVITGWPDIEILWRDESKSHATIMIFLEVKVPGGKLTEKQEALHKELKEDGHYVYVTHSVDETELILKEIGLI